MKCGAEQFFYNHLILQNINLKGDTLLVMLQLSVIFIVNWRCNSCCKLTICIKNISFNFSRSSKYYVNSCQGCMTKPIQLDNEGSYSSKQQPQNNL